MPPPAFFDAMPSALFNDASGSVNTLTLGIYAMMPSFSVPAIERLSGKEVHMTAGISFSVLRISRNVSGIGEEALAILREGQQFGEMSIIDDDVTRSADAIVHEDARMLLLPKEDLRDLMFVDRELAYEILLRFVRTLAGRLRESNDRLMMLSVSSKF